MMPSTLRWLALAALAGIALPGAARYCRAEDPADSSQAAEVQGVAPEAADPATAELLPPANPLHERPAAYVLPPVDQPLVPEFTGLDPLLDRPQAPLPGPFVNVESSIVKVHLRNQLIGPVRINDARTDIVQFSGNELNWAVTPRLEIGYRLPDGWGTLQIGYRFLATEGSDTLTTGLGAASQKGRLDYNLIDLDYTSWEYSLGPCWDLRWTAGVRLLFLYFDSRLAFLNASPLPGDVVSQSEVNSVGTIGFHGLLDLSRRTPIPGLAGFARLDGSGMVGRIHQTFAEQLAPSPDGSQPVFAGRRFEHVAGVPTLTPQVGLSYTVPGWNNSRFLAGYEYETMWDVGRIAETGSRAQVNLSGLFLRAEFNF